MYSLFYRPFKVFLCLIVFLNFVCCQNSKNNINTICNKTYCEKGILAGDKKEGIWKRYDNENNLIRIAKYKNDILHGAATSYYKDGQLYSVGNYRKGKFHGNVSVFYENGNLNFSDNYLKGEKDGYSYLFDREGWLKSKWLI